LGGKQISDLSSELPRAGDGRLGLPERSLEFGAPVRQHRDLVKGARRSEILLKFGALSLEHFEFAKSTGRRESVEMVV
jgi:hypothetical protein